MPRSDDRSESLTKEDYFRAAMKLLGTGGIGAVTIDSLCYRLRVTKGSFYHHFGSNKQFRRELLHHIEHEQIDRLKPFIEAMDPFERLTALKLGAVNVDHAAATALRAWARTDPEAAETQARLDRQVEELLTRYLTEAGVPAGRAPVLARIGMAIALATQMIERPVDRDRLLAMFDEYQRWLEATIERESAAPVVSVVGTQRTRR